MRKYHHHPRVESDKKKVDTTHNFNSQIVLYYKFVYQHSVLQASDIGSKISRATLIEIDVKFVFIKDSQRI